MTHGDCTQGSISFKIIHSNLFLKGLYQAFKVNLCFVLRRKASHFIDERVKAMNEVISGMRVIKMYTWEDSVTEWINKIRM